MASAEQPDFQIAAIDQLRSFAQDDTPLTGWHRTKTWNSIRAAGRVETKNPPRQSARRVSENLLGNSTSSLAVFYVEQVALNRHVLSVTAKRLTRRNRSYIVYA